MKQRTLAREVSIQGNALHTGDAVTLTMKPAPVDHGVVFKRVDINGAPELRPRVDQVVRQYGFTPVPLFLDCPSKLARERIARDVAENRHLARDRHPDIVGEVLARMEPPPPGSLSIDARLPAAEVCRLAVEAVASRAGIELR